MTDLHTAAKLALEALGHLWLFSDEAAVIANPAIAALREALVEQPAKQDIPDLIAGTLGVSRGTAYDLMREALQEVQQELVCIGYWNQKTGAYYKPDQISAAHKKLIEDGILRLCYTSPPEQRTPEETLDWLADQHRAQCGEDRPIQEWIRMMKGVLP